MIWLMSDTHFGHANIIRFSRRPFSSIEEMDQQLIDNINHCVAPSDTLYHLGDFSFRGQGAAHYREQINCRELHLTAGNHDPRYKNGQPKSRLMDIFSSVTTTLNLHIVEPGTNKKQLIVLNHWPLRTWDRSHYGTYHAYGHCHNQLPEDPASLSIDVGVDAIAHSLAYLNFDAEKLESKVSPEDYRPITILEFMKWVQPKLPAWEKSGRKKRV